MQKPIYSPDDEQLLMTRLWSPAIKDDPEAFVLFAFPWGQENTPLAKYKGPRMWQRLVLREALADVALLHLGAALQLLLDSRALLDGNVQLVNEVEILVHVALGYGAVLDAFLDCVAHAS